MYPNPLQIEDLQSCWDQLWYWTHEGWKASLTDGAALDDAIQPIAFSYRGLWDALTAVTASESTLKVSVQLFL